MTPLEQDTIELTAVKEQFLEAEKKLRELAQGAVELTRASVMLKKARMGVVDGAEGLRDLSGRLSEYIGSLADVTDRLGRATQAIEGVTAGQTSRKLDSLEDRLVEIHGTLGQVQGIARVDVESGQKELSAKTEQLGSISTALGSQIQSLTNLTEQLSASSRQLAQAGPAASQEQLGTVEERLSTRLDALARALAAAPTGQTGLTDERLTGLEQRLGRQIEKITTASAKTRLRAAADRPAQGSLDLGSEIATALEGIERDLESREATTVDMIAELRRSMGRELDRSQESLAAAISRGSISIEDRLGGLKRSVWWILVVALVGLAGIVALVFS